jgi:two-component system response regulator AtoC
MSVEPKQLSAAALDRLSAYHWPGNARQLENEIKRLVASVRGKIITEDQITIPSETKPVAPPTHAAPITGKSLFDAVEALERRMIQDALNQAGGNKLKAAQVLGMSRGGFLKKLKKLTRAPEA